MKICACGNEFVPSIIGNGSVMCNSCRANRRRWMKKLKCIEYLGGKCSKCEYSKCPEALDFHHRDPSTKKFTISGNATCSWETLVSELDKCDLVCANCHREVHWEEKSHKLYFNDYIPTIKIKKSNLKKERPVKISWPSTDDMIKEIVNTSFFQYARKIGVSDNAIRKHLKKNGIEAKTIRSIKNNGRISAHIPSV